MAAQAPHGWADTAGKTAAKKIIVIWENVFCVPFPAQDCLSGLAGIGE
jgi:hypothetical protein